MTASFDKVMNEHQVAWRERHIPYSDQGVQNRVRRPWLLPKNRWQDGLWEGIRDCSSNSLPQYLKEAKVQEHRGVHNLKSSWILCANLYFPFRQDRELLAGFLAQHVSGCIKSVDGIELEYAEPEPLDPSTLLGEPGGIRGTNQTSPDVAFIVTTTNDNKGLVLTENKLTEHSFYRCSGRDNKHGNPDNKRCLDFAKIYSDLANQCYQLNWENEHRPNRKYWDHIKISKHGHQVLKICPAANGGYQLFRQQALAEAIAQSGKYELVISCVAYDERNAGLIGCLKSMGIEDFRQGWASLFEGKTGFATFSHQQWIEWVHENDQQGRWQDWLKYVGERYGYGWNGSTNNNKGKSRYKPKLGSCEVKPNSYAEFRQKRDEWIRCLADTDDRNSLLNQLYWMTWNAAVFEVINEARRHAPTASSGDVKLNGMVHRLINTCFFESQSIAIRRLTDQGGLKGKRGVFSLTSLIEDMKKNVHLLTRENLFLAEELPIDPEPIRKQRDEYLQQKNRDGEKPFSTPPELNSARIVRRHIEIDKLCEVSAENRSPYDTIKTKIFDAMLDKLNTCQEVISHVNKFVAHAATPGSRATVNADDTGITLGHLRRAHEVLCRTLDLLDLYLLTRTNRRFLASAIFDKFEYIDRPLINTEKIEYLEEAWRRFEEETHKWSSNNLSWCLNEKVEEDVEF
ncbi:MAG: PGN_0703 family putative restriction endonuclease [Planctomycetota bacterium]|jgi:hypothetical protein